MALRLGFRKLVFELSIGRERLVVSALSGVESFLSRNLVVRNEGPVPVSRADLLRADLALVL